MTDIWMGAFAFEMGLNLILLFFVFRHTINKKIYGVKYSHYYVVDTGEDGYVHWNKDNEGVCGGKTKHFNSGRQYFGKMFFLDDCVEPLELEFSKEKMKYFCSSNEYETAAFEKVLKGLALSMAEKLMQFSVILILAVIVINIYVAFQVNGINEQLTYFKGLATTLSQAVVK